jgi:hypothetical protein
LLVSWHPNTQTLLVTKTFWSADCEGTDEAPIWCCSPVPRAGCWGERGGGGWQVLKMELCGTLNTGIQR